MGILNIFSEYILRMPRRRAVALDDELQTLNIGPPIPMVLHQMQPPIFTGDHLKKKFWEMAKALDEKFECSICLDTIDCKVGCERCFTILNCGHVYHLPCIIKCQPLQCPLCRDG